MSERPQTPPEFIDHFAQVSASIGQDELGSELEARLNREFSADSEWFGRAFQLCRTGCEDGWLCAREAGRVKFGRAVKPGPPTHGMSIDVVEMDDVVGPHHSHPNGESDLVMPLDEGASFDGRGAGWKVYPPGSAHHPTVTGGRALVLYLRPDGAIEFTGV